MNVLRAENTAVSARGRSTARGRGRGRGRDTRIVNNTQIVRVLPKYDFNNIRQPLVNGAPSSTNTFVTPKTSRIRNTTTSSSSCFRKSASRRRGRGSGGQISPHSVSSETEHCVILAITSGRGDARGEVGMAAIDVQYPHMILCQISDCNTYMNSLTKIHALNPIEIIMPDTMCERSIYGNDLHRAIKEKFDSVNITSIARVHFNDSLGMDRIQTHCAEEYSSVELVVKQKYYALAAASALFKYIEYIQHIDFASKSMRIEFQGSQNTSMIDIESAQSLELVTSQGGSGTFSLLGALDRCSTPMGRRQIRASILQPPCDLELIKSRQSCVTEFVSNQSFLYVIQRVVKRFYGASRLLSLAMLTSQTDNVQAAEKNLNYILLLKNVIDLIPELRSVMSDGQAPFLQKVAMDLQDPRYELIKEKILSVVHPEAKSVMGYTSSNMQRCFAIRSGLNDMLDIARQTYCELIDDMQKLVELLSDRYNLRLSLGCNSNLGYHIELDMPRSRNIDINKLPEELIEVHQQKNTLYMTTEYLMVLSQHCRDACEELHIMSNVLLNEAMAGVRQHIGCLFKLSDDIGELDLLLSIAQISSLSGYVLPTFGKRLELRESRHPIMDISSSDNPVPNDVVATSSYNFHTITGPNMSGKSVYLKQIVLLQIMAQMGCYVPAKEAHFRVADRIFCRMCPREDIESNASTFVLEIKESQYIFQYLTPTSLVVLDELCRSTTFEEGTSLAWAICEKLLRSSAFTFNATHFFYLTRLTELYHNVKNHYMEIQINSPQTRTDSRMTYTHKLKPGVVVIWHYGINLARSTGLPESVVSNANAYADKIAKSTKPSEPEKDSTDSWRKTFSHCLAEMGDFLERDDAFTVHNIVQLVNKYKIPSVLWRMKTSKMSQVERPEKVTDSVQFQQPHEASGKKASSMTSRTFWQKSSGLDNSEREEDTSSEQFCRNRDDQQQENGNRLSKRESTTSLSTLIGSRKSKILPEANRSFTSLAQLQFSGETTRKQLSTKTILESNEGSVFHGKNGTEPREVPMDFENSPCYSHLQVSNGEKDFNDILSLVVTSPNFQHLAGTSQQENDGMLVDEDFSQVSSVPTYIAKLNVRHKEADIFKAIEGSDFDEATFLRAIETSDDDDTSVEEIFG